MTGQTPTTAQPLSVIMAVRDQGQALERNLPMMLEQDYEPGYEVIVVDESSTDDTSDMLKKLKTQYPHLYTTYIPPSSHYLSRRKLALTLGMKAAKNEWVIITEATCRPEGEGWLNTMATALDNDSDMLCAYTPYDEGTPARWALLRMLTFSRQGSRPWRYDGACLVLRKSVFMQRNGFLKNLQFLRGEYDFLVNETPQERIALMRPDGEGLRQDTPTGESWTAGQMFYMQTRRHLRRTLWPRMKFVAHQLLLHLSLIALLCAIGLAAFLHNTVLLAVSIALLVLLAAGRICWIGWLAKKYGEHMAWWKIPFADLSIALHYVFFLTRYAMADKQDFARK